MGICGKPLHRSCAQRCPEVEMWERPKECWGQGRTSHLHTSTLHIDLPLSHKHTHSRARGGEERRTRASGGHKRQWTTWCGVRRQVEAPERYINKPSRGSETLTMSETIPLTDYAAAFVQALRQRTQVPRAGTPGTTVSGTASSQKLVSIHRKGCSIQLVGAWSEADPRLTSPFRPLSNRLSGSRTAPGVMHTRSTTGTSRISA